MIKIIILILLNLGITMYYKNTVFFSIGLGLAAGMLFYLVYINAKLTKQSQNELNKIEEKYTNELKKYNELEFNQLFLFLNQIKIPMILIDDYGIIMQKNKEFNTLFTSIPKEIITEVENLLGSKKIVKEITYSNKVYGIEKYYMNLDTKEMYLFFIIDKTQELKNKKIQEDFISNMSHELRNPLTTLISCHTFLKRDIPNSEKDTFLEIMESELAKMKNLVEDIFVISKIEDEKLNFQKIDIYKLLKNLIENYRLFHEDINFIIKGKQCFINGDSEKMNRVFTNVLDNSIKYNASKITIEVLIKDNIEILIIDNGLGINEADLPFIFERFYKGDKSRNPNIDSSGLGLTICQEIIGKHDGKITIDSEENKYTRVKIILPKEKK